jgi:hypothetical protein
LNEQFEEFLLFIENKLNEHEQALTDISDKVDKQGGQFDNDDSSLSDYHEGAIEALAIVLFRGRGMFND